MLKPCAGTGQGEAGAAGEAVEGVAAGWQEAYYCLILVEKLFAHAPAEVLARPTWELS